MAYFRFSLFALTVVACLLSPAALPPAGEGGGDPPAFRAIPVPREGSGYSRGKTTVIRSQDELDALLAKLPGWDWRGFPPGPDNEVGKKALVDAIRVAEIDFAKEALVLQFHEEGSGSNQVSSLEPELDPATGKLTLRIRVKRPEVGTADMAYYCFAFAVSKAEVGTVRFEVVGAGGGKPLELPVSKPKP